MAIIAKWSGDGLSDGTTITTSTAGTGDTAFDTINGTGGNVVVRSSGTRPPRLEFPAFSSQTKYLTWGSSIIGSRTSYAVRMYATITAYGGLSSSIFRFRNSSTEIWRVDIAGTSGAPPGEVRLRGASGVLLDDSDSLGLSINTLYRFEGVVSGGTVTLKVYEGESLSAWDTLTGSIGTTIDTFDVGCTVNTTTSIQYFDDIAVGNTATEIGPVVTSTATVTVWNGTTEVPATIQGVWNGSTVTPGTFDDVV